MAPTRALFASIGASVALVAAAALSLLAISAVFAFGGWSDSVSPLAKQPALVFAGSKLAQPEGEAIAVASAAKPIVAPAPARRAERRDVARPATPASSAVRATEDATAGVSGSGSDVPPLDTPDNRPAADPPRAQPAAPKSGDHVRKVGDSLSSAVQNTGTALSNVTQPLAPPVSAAVQQVLNLVAEAVRRAADGLGSTLDTLLPPKK